MNAKEIIKSMKNIEALLAPLDTPISPNDAQHRVNNARQIAQGVKVMLEMEKEEQRAIHRADDLESDHQAEAAQEALGPDDEDETEEDDSDGVDEDDEEEDPQIEAERRNDRAMDEELENLR